MSAHDQPGLSNITNLAVAVAFLQRRVPSVHEIASCHFDSASSDRTWNLVLIRVGEGLRPGWLGSGLGGKVKLCRDGRQAGAATSPTTTLTSAAFLVIWKILGAICPLSLGRCDGTAVPGSEALPCAKLAAVRLVVTLV